MSDIVVFSTTQRILVDPLAPFRIATSRLQRIIVNPSTSSVSVINAGPMGPRGLTGATGPSEAAVILTVDGDILTRAAGVLAPITRSNLATDLAGNAGFTSKYARVINHAAVAGTARGGTGAILWIGSVNPTNATDDDELFRTDTVVLSKRIGGVWVVVSGSIFVGNSAPASPTDGKLWWDTDDVAIVPPLSAATLAADSAFTSKYELLATRHAQGWLGAGNNVSLTTSGTTPLTLLATTTFAIAANRRVRWSLCLNGYGNTLNDTFQVKVYSAAGGTLIHTSQFQVSGAGTYMLPLSLSGFDTPAASGSTSYLATITRVGGTGTFTMSATATFTNHITVEDVGT